MRDKGINIVSSLAAGLGFVVGWTIAGKIVEALQRRRARLERERAILEARAKIERIQLGMIDNVFSELKKKLETEHDTEKLEESEEEA